MKSDFDVVIAGAGPAGLSAAMRLVKRNPSLKGRILVLDRAQFPRPKPCGGGLTGHAVEAMSELGFELTVPWVEARRARVQFGGFMRRTELARPVKIIRRQEFDASLLAQVRDHGVEVLEGEGLKGFEVDTGMVTVFFSSRQVRAHILVGADGVGSMVRRRITNQQNAGDFGGSLPSRRRGQPMRLFQAEIPAPPGWEGDMLYDFSPMSAGMRGYLWVFPAPGDRLNVGVLHYPTTSLSGSELRELLVTGLGKHGLPPLFRELRGWPAWGYAPSQAVSAPHILLLGDAAGIDALTGEGIAPAMEHALVAVEAILSALDRGDFGFDDYRLAIRRATVGRELNLDRWLSRFLYGRWWKTWLSLILFDAELLDLYAARVAGGLVLADQKAELALALFRHVIQFVPRRLRLRRECPG